MALIGAAVPVVLEPLPVELHHPSWCAMAARRCGYGRNRRRSTAASSATSGVRIEPCQTNGGTPSSGRGARVKPCSGGAVVPVSSRRPPRATAVAAARSARPSTGSRPGCPARTRGRPGPVLPRPNIRSMRPPERFCSTLKSSAIFTGSLVVIKRRRSGQDDPVGLRRDVAQQGGRRRRHERRVVMLTGGEHVQSDLLGLLRDRHRRAGSARPPWACGRWSDPAVTSPTVKIPNCMPDNASPLARCSLPSTRRHPQRVDTYRLWLA